ncbi:MAG: hypothetical protein KQI35_04880 [Bacteroidetes bacterium]|nr:hypothetical protein [Bacteroidota bacterium]
MTGLIILAVLIFALAWLLLAPLYLYIHTGNSRYEAGMTGLLKVKLVSGAYSLPELLVRVLFFHFRLPLIQLGSKKGKPVKTKKKKKKSIKGMRFNLSRGRMFLKIVWKVVTSFKLKKFFLNIDTGNVVTNAYLFPVFSVLGGKKYELSVNYVSKNELIIHYENNLLTIFTHIIFTFIKHKLKY